MAKASESSGALRENGKVRFAIIAAVVILAGSCLMRSCAKARTSANKASQTVTSQPVKKARVPSANICSDFENIRVGSGEAASVHVRPNCWSGSIAPELDRAFNINAPDYGYIEYCYWSDDRCQKVTKTNADEQRWINDNIPRSSFRLRGTEGVAVITVE